jgi:hypothetical protein
VQFAAFIDQLFEQNISQSIQQREILFTPKPTLKFTVTRVDHFQQEGLVGFQDHHTLDYTVRVLSNLDQEVLHIKDLHCNISNIYMFASQKNCLVFMSDKTIALFEGSTILFKLKGPEVIHTVCRNIDTTGLLLTAGVSGTFYSWEINKMIGTRFLNVAKASIENWRMISRDNNHQGKGSEAFKNCTSIEWIQTTQMLALGSWNCQLYIFTKEMVNEISYRPANTN